MLASTRMLPPGCASQTKLDSSAYSRALTARCVRVPAFRRPIAAEIVPYVPPVGCQPAQEQPLRFDSIHWITCSRKAKTARHKDISYDPVQRAAGGGQGVDAAGDFGVFHQRRGVVRLDAGVDHQRAAAAPVLVVGERVDAVDVGGGVGARERDPEEVVERLGDELAVVDERRSAEER